MVLDFTFFNDLRNAEKSEYLEVANKHKLSPHDRVKVAGILKEGKLEEEWFNQLYVMCKGCGLLRSNVILEKYQIKEDGIEGRIFKRWEEEGNRGEGNN